MEEKGKKEPVKKTVKKTVEKKDIKKPIKKTTTKKAVVADNKKEEVAEKKVDIKPKEFKLPPRLFENIAIVLILIICTATFFVLMFNKNEPYKESSALEKFEQEFYYILENYYGEITEDELIESAIEGMLSDLDINSGFLDDEDSNESKTLAGTYEGVGIEIFNDAEGKIIISKVHANSPAELIGLMAGDEITKYNDEDLTGVSTGDLVTKIASVETFNLEIKRLEELFTVQLQKGSIIIESVHATMLDGNIGYIIIDIFADNTAIQFTEALEELENNGMEKLIVDVRNNSGGYLTTVEDIASEFFDSSYTIFKTEDNKGTDIYKSKGDETKEYPIVVLQNGLSASASEVLAAALKENLNAYIIGTTSYGKGTVQTVNNVDGLSDYKLTTKKWLTPNDNWINEVGITPDSTVELNIEYYLEPSYENDNQLQAAIEYLK